jgi:4,5-DOPA dioxygenase extradiol
MPAIFVAHGAPTLAIEHDEYTEKLGNLGQTLHDARGVVIVSAHWQARPPVRVNTVERPSMIYIEALRTAGIDVDREQTRGWDHGVWVPLLHLLPKANLPVVQVSLPYGASPEELMAIGSALKPLRERGVAIIGSGGIVHNLREVALADKSAAPAAWAAVFDSWVATRVEQRDVKALAEFRASAPNAARAVPTDEHFAPLFIVLGASDDDDRFEIVHEGFQYGTLSVRTLAFV